MCRMLCVLGMLEIFVRAHRRLRCSPAHDPAKCWQLAEKIMRHPIKLATIERTSPATQGKLAHAKLLDERCDKPVTIARYPPRYRSASSTARRGRAAPGSCGGRRRAP